MARQKRRAPSASRGKLLGIFPRSTSNPTQRHPPVRWMAAWRRFEKLSIKPPGRPSTLRHENDLQLPLGDPRLPDANGPARRPGQIDDPPLDVGAPVVDPHLGAFAAFQVGDLDDGS